MTGSSMVNGYDMTGSHVTGSDVIFPRFFLTIVLAYNISLRMTGSSMANGFEMTESDVREVTSQEVTS